MFSLEDFGGDQGKAGRWVRRKEAVKAWLALSVLLQSAQGNRAKPEERGEHKIRGKSNRLAKSARAAGQKKYMVSLGFGSICKNVL